MTALPPGLYAIADSGFGDPVALGEALFAAGCLVVQLRCKGWSEAAVEVAASRLVGAARARGAMLIVNDRIAVVARVGAHGVHLGQDDGDATAARAALGPGALIGRSTHDLGQVAAAGRDPSRIDYIGFGPVFGTTTKADAEGVRGVEGLAAAVAVSAVPVVAIGGIDAGNLPLVKAAGAHSWAVISALVGAPDLGGAVRALR